MKNAPKLTWIIAIVAVISFGMTACDDGNGSTTTHTHQWGEWTQTTPPTCTEAGIKIRTCTLDPSHIDTETQVGDPALGHDWEQISGTEPTCTEAGNGKRKCKRCEEEEEGNFPAHGHSYGGWIVTKPATETVDGQETQTCTICGHEHHRTISATGDIITNIADLIDYLETQTGGITASEPILLNISIDLEEATKVQELLTAINNAEKYVEIDLSKAYGTTISLWDETKMIFEPQIEKKWITSITISDSIQTIGEKAFDNCTSLTSITIPDNVESIEREAFQNCTNLESVTIGNSVDRIEWFAFNRCYSLAEIQVSVGNTAYSSIDGVLYTKDQKTLWVYPAGKGNTFTIPNSIESIWHNAFYRCTSLESVIIGNSIKSIGDSAFYGCTSLESVAIGNSVESIGISAFYLCPSITSVTIPDSVQSIGAWAFHLNDNLASVTFDGTIPSSGFATSPNYPFPGNLRTVFYTGDYDNGIPGIYTATRTEGDNATVTWTKHP